ncbi:hypothetical protein AZE42_12765 [Rhizopogon vesiculosus]|uniref:Uncharacterized protein n=1 Tax=Rhizopogon vesiculosus TaxID=180088 RepID=A0A1J8Q285_9AGAM|nr:hypothetical protein AZE42_12765 [Rhizopogon vesiculosus]
MRWLSPDRLGAKVLVNWYPLVSGYGLGIKNTRLRREASYFKASCWSYGNRKSKYAYLSQCYITPLFKAVT